MDFLNKKNYRPPHSSFDSDVLPMGRKPLKDVDKAKPGAFRLELAPPAILLPF